MMTIQMQEEKYQMEKEKINHLMYLQKMEHLSKHLLISLKQRNIYKKNTVLHQ